MIPAKKNRINAPIDQLGIGTPPSGRFRIESIPRTRQVRQSARPRPQTFGTLPDVCSQLDRHGQTATQKITPHGCWQTLGRQDATGQSFSARGPTHRDRSGNRGSRCQNRQAPALALVTELMAIPGGSGDEAAVAGYVRKKLLAAGTRPTPFSRTTPIATLPCPAIAET